MQQSLLAEQEDQLGTGRGLLPNSDGQCFTMLVNDVLVQQLNRLRSHLLHPLSQRTLERRRSMNHAPGLPHHTSRISARMTQSWQAYFALNQLLTGVLNHLYSQYEYVVRQRSAFELMLDAEFPPADLEEQKTIFYAGTCTVFTFT